MEVDKVADMEVDMVADVEVDMVPDMEVDKVAAMVATKLFMSQSFFKPKLLRHKLACASSKL